MPLAHAAILTSLKRYNLAYIAVCSETERNVGRSSSHCGESRMTLQVGWRSELDDGDGAIVCAVVENPRSRERARIFDVVEQQARSAQFRTGLAPPRNLALRLVRSA